jgi:hypothetical protein
VDYIAAHRQQFGVVPICRVLSQHGIPIAPSTFYAVVRARAAGPTPTQVRDVQLCKTHPAGACRRELRGLRCAPGVAGAQPGGHNGGTLHGGTADVSTSPAGSATVALSGNGVLSAFPQPDRFVCGFHVAVLTPKRKMTVGELLWWCHLIHSNAYRYSYGRQANRTLASLLLPTAIPDYVSRVIEAAREDRLFPSQRGA